MLVGIHEEHYGKIGDVTKKFEIILDFNKIPYIHLNASQSNFWDKVRKLDLFIYMWKHEDYYKRIAICYFDIC